MKRRWNNGDSCLVSIFPSRVWIKDGQQKQIFRSLGGSWASASEKSHCVLSESGMVYRFLGYDFTDTADWNFQKNTDSAKIQEITFPKS